jgi:inosine-uridine nucleoside N-ribohydrolase
MVIRESGYLMKTLILLFAFLSGSALTAITSVAAEPSQPVKIIFDTDMGNDCDDALALGLIHALQSRGACELLAVTLTHPSPDAGAYVDAVNTFYGRPDIVIGVNPSAPMPSESRFLKVAHQKNGDGTLMYPHDFDATNSPHAIPLLRSLLAKAEANSIVLVQVGFFTNFAALLESGADEFSPLSGVELVRQKVRFLSVMGGCFQTVNQDNRICEFNVRFDVKSAQTVAAKWPTPIIWSGMEIGIAVPFPATAIDHDYRYVPNHPVKDAYQLYLPTPHERPTWDLTSVLYAVYPERDYFELSSTGRVSIEEDGFSRFKPDRKSVKHLGRDRFMIVSKEQAARLRGLFEALCTEPAR